MKAFITSYWLLKTNQDLVFNSDQVLQGQRALFLPDVYSFWFIGKTISVINALTNLNNHGNKTRLSTLF